MIYLARTKALKSKSLWRQVRSIKEKNFRRHAVPPDIVSGLSAK